MTEEDARLELLKAELKAVHSSIQGFDTIVFQIKGWCVTVVLAIGGFAVSSHAPALTLVGIVAVVGFFLLNCQFKAIQRSFIKRNAELARELSGVGIMQVLKGGGTLEIIGTAIPNFNRAAILASEEKVREMAAQLLYEARLPNTFTLYLFLFACLALEAIMLFA